MATLSQLKSRVMDIIKDQYFRNAVVTKHLNAAVTDIAAGLPSMLGTFLTPPLPELFTIDIITTVTDAAYVSMPTTFQRSLVFAGNESNTEIDIANSWIAFVGADPLLVKSGSLYEVIELGKNLYYQRIPSTAEDITLHFYRFPVLMSADTDEPDGIPANFHERLLVNYAAYRTYETLEEGEKAAYYESLFMKALSDFELSLPYDTRPLNLI